MSIKLGLLQGDGIGPEIVPAARRVIDCCVEVSELEVEYEDDLPIGWDAYNGYGSTAPTQTLERLASCDGWILGPMLNSEFPEDDDIYPNSPSGKIRKHFDLYANIRPARGFPRVTKDDYEDMNLVIFRQNTEGFYADRNMKRGVGMFKPTDDLEMAVRVITRKECRRILKRGYEFAAANEKFDKVTVVHKGSVFRYGGAGIFLEENEKIASEFPQIHSEDANVDAFAMNLIRNPTDHDVIVTTNMFGDILSDEAVGLAGSLGLGGGLNAGDKYAMAQATHGAAPDIAGQGIANPTSMVLSTKMLLEWFGRRLEHEAAETCANLIDEAVENTIAAGDVLPPDIGGDASTDEYTDQLLQEIRLIVGS